MRQTAKQYSRRKHVFYAKFIVCVKSLIFIVEFSEFWNKDSALFINEV